MKYSLQVKCLEKPKSTSLLTHSGMLSIYHNLNVSQKHFAPSWIMDSRTTDYMTNISKLFKIYTSCSSNKKKFIIADGLLIVAGVRTIKLNSHSTLTNVLHVPKLYTNLISVCLNPNKIRQKMRAENKESEEEYRREEKQGSRELKRCKMVMATGHRKGCRRKTVKPSAGEQTG